jgi:predicted ArsR family transcriptional regulator
MVLRMIEAQSAPVSTAALSAATGLHENTVRGHLDQLFADGYIGRQRESAAGRGRPAWLWVAARPDPENPYAALAGVLADTLARSGGDPVAQAREAGRRWGQEIAARRAGASGMTVRDAAAPPAAASSASAPPAAALAASTPPAAAMPPAAGPGASEPPAAASLATARETVIDVMREQGFAPDDTGDDILLRRCPLIEAATRHPTIVCAVHQGMIDGVLASTGDRADTRLIPFSAPGRCTLQLRVAS